MKIKIRKREGFWKVWFAYYTPNYGEYEVLINKFSSFREAIAATGFIVNATQ